MNVNRWKIVFGAMAVFCVAACGSNPVASNVDCGSGGNKTTTSVGVVCSYAVVTGGFRCPDGVPHRIDLPGRTQSEMARVLCTQPGLTLDRIPPSSCVGFEERCAANQVDGGFDASDARLDGARVDAGPFVCCPIDTFDAGEACGYRDKRIGGSAPTLAECRGPQSMADGAPSILHNDSNGCPVFSQMRGVGEVCGRPSRNCALVEPAQSCPMQEPTCTSGNVASRTWDQCPTGQCVPFIECNCVESGNVSNQCGGVAGTQCVTHPMFPTQKVCGLIGADGSTPDAGSDAGL